MYHSSLLTKLFQHAANLPVGSHHNGDGRYENAEEQGEADEADFRHDFRQGQRVLAQFEELGGDDFLNVHECDYCSREGGGHQQQVFSNEGTHQQEGVNAEAFHQGVNKLVLPVFHAGKCGEQNADNDCNAQAEAGPALGLVAQDDIHFFQQGSGRGYVAFHFFKLLELVEMQLDTIL